MPSISRQRSPLWRVSRLVWASAAVALVAACGGSSASSTPTTTPAATATSIVAAASATPTLAPATPTLAPATPTAPPAASSASASPAPTSAASPRPTPTAAPRTAWRHGQTVKQYDLVAPRVGWVLTTTGLWQTIDDGASWANAYPRRLIARTIRGFGALDANHAMLAAVDVFPGTSRYYVWRTGNAGLTWTYTALPPIPNEVPATPCAPGDFCGQPGDPAATFDYVDANTAFVYVWMRSGIDGLYTYIFETTDGGATWAARTYAPPDPGTGSGALYRVHFMNKNIGVAEFDDQISSTISGWGHWTHRHLPTTDYSEPPISFVSQTKWYGDLGLGFDLGSVTYNYTISTDQGHHWTDHRSTVPGIANLSGAQVQFLGPLEWIGTEQTTSGLGAGASQTIYTTDGGHHWALEGAQPFNGSMATFIDGHHGWTGPNDLTSTAPARLYSTSDGGRTWRLLTP